MFSLVQLLFIDSSARDCDSLSLFSLIRNLAVSGLKEVKPPVEFGERTQDCSPGHAGKEDPHLAMTGASCWFSRAVVPVCGF